MDTSGLRPRLVDHEGARLTLILLVLALVVGVPAAWASVTPPPQRQAEVPEAIWSTAFPERSGPGLVDPHAGVVIVEASEASEPAPPLDPAALVEGRLVRQAPPEVARLYLRQVTHDRGRDLERAFVDHQHALVACTSGLPQGSFTLHAQGRVQGVSDRFTADCLGHEVRSWGLSGEGWIELELLR